MSKDDWDQHWDELPEMMEINPAFMYRRRLIYWLLGLDRVTAPARVLDVGCGDGSLVESMKARWPEVDIAGMDLSQTGIELAQRRVPAAKFFRVDLTDPDATPPAELRDWATHAICAEVIEHVDDPRALLRGIMPYLAPGASLVLTVPGGPMSMFDHHVGHRKHYTRHVLAGELRDAGFEIDRICCAGFPFHNLYRLAVLMRRDAVIADAQGEGGDVSSVLAKAAFRVFNCLFNLNLPSTPFGWQIVARVRRPQGQSSGVD